MDASNKSLMEVKELISWFYDFVNNAHCNVTSLANEYWFNILVNQNPPSSDKQKKYLMEPFLRDG